jgi:hypothetical protein
MSFPVVEPVKFKENRVGLVVFDSVQPPPLMPRWATTLNFVIPTEADSDFLLRGASTPLSWTGNPG